MKNWTIAKRLVVGFGLVVVIATGLGVFASVRLAGVNKLSDAITKDALPGVTIFGHIEASGLQNLALVMEHTATDDTKRIDAIEKQISEMSVTIDKLMAEYEKTIFDARDRQLFEQFKQARATLSGLRKTYLGFSRQHTAAQSLADFNATLRPAYDAYLAATTAEVNFNRSLGDTYGTDITNTVSEARTWTAVGILLMLTFGLAIAFAIIRSTNGILRSSVSALTEGAEQVVSAASQVATSAQSLSQGATEQAASLEETSASMEEMASMARKNAEHTHEAAGLMGEIDKRVSDSNSSLSEMIASMSAIEESSNKVAKIIKTIDEIAFQTNILALNAAVEAARAGDAGMGFAVVADEVRNLAQRSAQAARDTAGLIEESITRSSEGSRKVEQVAGSIGAITESVTRVKGIVAEVREASSQQAQGIDQVSQAIAQMEKVTQTTAATAEESAAASEELNAQAESSLTVVHQLETLVGGQKAVAPKAPAFRRAGHERMDLAA